MCSHSQQCVNIHTNLYTFTAMCTHSQQLVHTRSYVAISYVVKIQSHVLIKFTAMCTNSQQCVQIHSNVYKFTAMCTNSQQCVQIHSNAYTFTAMCTVIFRVNIRNKNLNHVVPASQLCPVSNYMCFLFALKLD